MNPRAWAWVAVLGAALSINVSAAEPAGTTIVGEQEAAVGLYLLPWAEESASDIDRPPRLYTEPARPIEPALFNAQVEYDETRAAYQRARLERPQK